MSYLAVDAVRARSRRSWPWLPLRRVARIRREANLSSDAELLALSSDDGVKPRPDDGGRQLPSETTISGYWLVQPGDLVFNPMWAIGRGVAVSQVTGAVSTAYRVYELGPRLHPRFLHYYMRCDPIVEQYGLVVRGLTTFDRSVTREDLEGMPVPVPQVVEQRAIADYLDAETARINALIAKKRRMIEVTRERLSAATDALIGATAGSARTILLGQVLERLIDYRGATPEKSETGVPLVTASNIIDGRVDLESSPQFIPEHLYSGWMRRGLPRFGDLLLTTEAPLGEVAPISEIRVALAQRLILLRGRPDLVTPEYLLTYLRCGLGQSRILARASGSTVMGIRTDRLRSVPVVVPDLETQRDIVRRLEAVDESSKRLVSAIARQTALLVEHRQALITAAVTGELLIPGVAA